MRRLDIGIIIAILSKCNNCPNEMHCHAAQQVLVCLHHIKSKGIMPRYRQPINALLTRNDLREAETSEVLLPITSPSL